ncbi:MAG: hypothetical protein DWQ02_24800 [Bacteroidetes bacterium]|nr:MAG: hypothetical protein DWQ02_24800 [Bacteroidota bacterium]
MKNQEQPNQFTFWKTALFFGGFMYVFMIILFPLMTRDEITTRSLLLGIPIWAIAGVLYAYLMKKFPYKSKSQK